MMYVLTWEFLNLISTFKRLKSDTYFLIMYIVTAIDFIEVLNNGAIDISWWRQKSQFLCTSNWPLEREFFIYTFSTQMCKNSN